MRFREFVAEQTIALVAAQAQSIMLARMADWPESEEPPKINYSELVWGAVLVAQRLEQTGLAPWVSSNKGGHKDAAEALSYFQEMIKQESQEGSEPELDLEDPMKVDRSYDPTEDTLNILADGANSITDELIDDSEAYKEPAPEVFVPTTPLDLGKV